MSSIYRPYAKTDRDSCLRLFDSNTPAFFSTAERPDFTRFLDGGPSDYGVIVSLGEVVACGGYVVESDGLTASLCWGMVDRERHKAGLGRQLTAARLQAIRATSGVRFVRLDTSQHTQGFYARFGFEAEAVARDGYGPGLDRVDMVLRLGEPSAR